MRTVYMHIGMPKAGSTSIQRSFNGYDDGSVRYAQLGHPCHSMKMNCAFSLDPLSNKFINVRQIGAEKLRSAQKECMSELKFEMEIGRKALVISGEGIDYLEKPDIHQMILFFDDNGYKVQILAYIREPVGFASSAFQQRAKSEGASFQVARPNYRRRYEDFIDVVGRGDIIFRPFRRDSLRLGSVVFDFADQIGLNSEALTEVSSNESLSTAAVAHLFFWNKQRKRMEWTPENNLARELVVEHLRHAFPGRFSLSHEMVRSSMNVADIEWMEEVCGFDLRSGSGSGSESGTGAAIRDEQDLAAVRDETLPQLAVFLDGLGVEVPSDPDGFAMMAGLFRHSLQGARKELERRRARRPLTA